MLAGLEDAAFDDGRILVEDGLAFDE